MGAPSAPLFQTDLIFVFVLEGARLEGNMLRIHLCHLVTLSPELPVKLGLGLRLL